MVTEILSGHAIRNLRKAQGVLRLADKYGPDRLVEACDYLLHFGATELRRLTRVLEQGIPPSWQPRPRNRRRRPSPSRVRVSSTRRTALPPWR